MRERNLGEKNPNFGKTRSEETKRKIGEANRIAQKGKKHSEETKEKMSKSHQIDQPILCVETGIIYSCPSKAGESVGGKNKSGHIVEVCKGKRKTAYKYHWEYVQQEE